MNDTSMNVERELSVAMRSHSQLWCRSIGSGWRSHFEQKVAALPAKYKLVVLPTYLRPFRSVIEHQSQQLVGC